MYVDHIIIPGKTFDANLQNLHSVLLQMRKENLKLQPPKCIFAHKSVRFLDHVISAKGIATDTAKGGNVTTWPLPTRCSDVQQLLHGPITGGSSRTLQ